MTLESPSHIAQSSLLAGPSSSGAGGRDNGIGEDPRGTTGTPPADSFPSPSSSSQPPPSIAKLSLADQDSAGAGMTDSLSRPDESGSSVPLSPPQTNTRPGEPSSSSHREQPVAAITGNERAAGSPSAAAAASASPDTPTPASAPETFSTSPETSPTAIPPVARSDGEDDYVKSPAADALLHTASILQSQSQSQSYSQDASSSSAIPPSGLRPSESTPLKRLSALSAGSTSDDGAGAGGFTPVRGSEIYSSSTTEPRPDSSGSGSYTPPSPLKVVDFAFHDDDPRRIGAKDVSLDAGASSRNMASHPSSAYSSSSSSSSTSSRMANPPRFRFRAVADDDHSGGVSSSGRDGGGNDGRVKSISSSSSYSSQHPSSSSSHAGGDDDWGPEVHYDEEEEEDDEHDGVGGAAGASTSASGIYRVLYDFEAESEHELTVSAGETVTVVGTVDGGWAVGFKDDGKEGLVPEGYLEWVSSQ